MGLEKTIHTELRQTAHSYICGKKSKTVRWPTPVAGISEITYKQKILSGRTGGDRTLGRPRSRGLDGFIIHLV
jgi:hypothetical protein